MNKLLLIAALPLLLSACKQPEPPASVADPLVADSAPQAEAADELPEGIVLDVPYTLISDDWIQQEDARKRKTVIEFQQADAAVIGQQLSDSMVAAGYRLTGTSEARGGERFNFRGDPNLRVSILVRPRGAVALKSSKSTGNIEFGYTQLAEAASDTGQGSN